MPAIGTLTMILTNVGLSVFNSVRSWKTNNQIQEKQKEFGKAKIKRERERMLENMRAGQVFSQEVEEQMHQQRLEELNASFDKTITKLFYIQNINTWPLNVLPIVLKKGMEMKEGIRIPMLCIVAPSNDRDFNRHVFPLIEREIGEHIDSYYGVRSSHNIIYLSQGWKSGQMPTGSEIDQLRMNLQHLPVLLIYPFFEDSSIRFIINIWGMGGASSISEMILKPDEDTFSYSSLMNSSNPDYSDYVLNTTEEFSLYLKTFIGYVADTYYWNLYGERPILPSMMSFTHYLGTESYIDDYKNLLKQSLSDESMIVNSASKRLNLFQGIVPCLTSQEKDEYIINTIQKYSLSSEVSSQVISDCYSYQDIDYLESLHKVASAHQLRALLEDGIESLRSRIPCSFVQTGVISLSEVFMSAIALFNEHEGYEQVNIRFFDNSIVIAILDGAEQILCDSDNPGCHIIQFEGLDIPERVKLEKDDLTLTKQEVESYYNRIINL